MPRATPVACARVPEAANERGERGTAGTGDLQHDAGEPPAQRRVDIRQRRVRKLMGHLDKLESALLRVAAEARAAPGSFAELEARGAGIRAEARQVALLLLERELARHAPESAVSGAVRR